MGRRRRDALRGLVWTAVALIAAASIAIALMLWKLRGDALDDAFKDTGNVATVLAEQTNQIAKSFDLLLSDVQGRVLGLGVTTPEQLISAIKTEYGHALLKSRRDQTPQADVITVIDSGGHLLATSRAWPAPSLDLSDRDYFNHFRIIALDRSLHISAPVNNRTTGVSTIFFSKALFGANDAFLGVVTVGIAVDQFRQVYETISLLGQQSFTLLRSDGTVFVHYPDGVDRAGARLPSSSDWHALAAKGGGHAIIQSGVYDGRPHVVSVRGLREYPLVVNVAVTQEHALAGWMQRAIYIAAGLVVVLVCSGILLIAGAAQLRQLRAAEAALVERRGELRSKSAELAAARAQTGAAINNISQGISMFDGEQRLVVCNPRYLELYGLSPDAIKPGCSFTDILEYRRQLGNYTGDPKAYVAKMMGQVRKGERFEHTARLPAGRLLAVAAHPMPDGGWVSTHEDVTERTRSQALIAHMARHDSLTGLPNRVVLEQKFDEALTRLARHGERFAVALFDLDQFKAVNDTLGHPAGDALLQVVAERLRLATRDLDTVSRWGGDEFVVLLSGMDDPASGAHAFAQRLLATLSEPFLVKGREVRIGASIGLTIAPDDGADMNELLRHADLALYRAKEKGRNRYEDYHPSMEAGGDARLSARG